VVASGAAILEQLHGLALPSVSKTSDPGVRLAAIAALRGPEAKLVSHAFLQAGSAMAYAVDSIMSVLNPDLVLLAGAAGRQPDYLKGVQDKLASLRGAEDAARIQPSAVTSNDSAVWLGLSAFVYSQDLNIERLRAA